MQIHNAYYISLTCMYSAFKVHMFNRCAIHLQQCKYHMHFILHAIHMHITLHMKQIQLTRYTSYVQQ